MFVLVVATICAQIAVFTTGIQGAQTLRMEPGYPSSPHKDSRGSVYTGAVFAWLYTLSG